MATRKSTIKTATPHTTARSARRVRERMVRRHEIVHAARAVFAEKGFASATLEEIAERAEYGKGTVYNYFDSKESLFTAAMMDLFDDVARIAQQVSQLDMPIRDMLVEYMHRMVAYYQINFDFCRMMMSEWVRPELEGLTCPLDELDARIQAVAEPLVVPLKSAMRRGQIRRADPLILAKMFISMVHDYYVMNMAPPKPIGDIKTQTELVVSLFFDGVRAPGSHAKA